MGRTCCKPNVAWLTLIGNGCLILAGFQIFLGGGGGGVLLHHGGRRIFFDPEGGLNFYSCLTDKHF